jgi:hypothetical protein
LDAIAGKNIGQNFVEENATSGDERFERKIRRILGFFSVVASRGTSFKKTMKKLAKLHCY